ncbi:BamA/TamA family outer membrane protein [Hymenobacter taeanensis]|uniref:BamA/TamA family outer membrane protein n=1 Tax=Hymenobacter taeanensis TaxID=2735321 RepID=A0A6M6BM82_9BACT|nr:MULTISPECIES: BamA/TamA family outer membrane protein [Hymenobacter]QJX48904.1 BamA/TamA family outer membrane protein [Hymenobacter taeanensis]UOQ81581.1 outer membrane protein assembly factor [Hymenobacter sp. 5414T-23]
MRYIYSLIFLGIASATQAQVVPAPTLPDSAAAPAQPRREKPSFIPLPIVFSQPETGLGYGLAVLPVWRFGQDTAVRKSNARLVAWRTQKNQSLLQLTHNVFTLGEAFLLTGEASYYYKFPINYYGFGPDTRLADKSIIEYKVFIFNERVLKRVAPNVFVGGQYRLTNLRDVQLNEGIDQDPNRSRLFDRPAREYTQDTRISGIGPSFLYDGRDNVLSTYRGNYLELGALFNGRALGSDFRFSRFVVDARHFQPLGEGTRTILATQIIGQFQSGDTPFRELANLGGDKTLRGYYEGRFRDRQLLAVQAELRRHLFWRFNGVVFGGLGQVGNTVGALVQRAPKASAGAGLRFAFNRQDRLNIRLDYGRGAGSSGVYFSIGEAF